MIKRQLNPLRIGKGLLSLLAMFMMLLAPQGAWAEDDYGLTVAGVAVTSANASSITGQYILKGTVSYTPKTSTTPATLTLDGAEILGEIVSSKDEDLTILVIGINKITTSLDHAIIGKSESTNNNLRLTYNGTGNGVELRVDGLSSIDELPLNWISCTKIWKTSEWDFGENEEGLNPDLCDWYTKEKCGFISIAPATKYNVWIGGIQLTSNHDSSDGVSFSENYNRLTLENATIAPTNASGIEYKGTDDFTILLKGKNSIQTTGSYEAIRYGGQQTAAPQLTFKEDTDGYPCSLQLKSAVTVISSGFGSIAGINGINQINTNDNKLELTPANPLQYGANGLVTTDDTPAAVTSVTFGTPFETYDVSVAGTSVTSDNYQDVLENGTVSFDSQTNTLILNNATIDMSQKTGYPIESSITNLNVKLIGSSVLTPNSTSKSGIRYTGSGDAPTVTLNIGDSAYGLLKVNGVSDRDAMFSGYTNTNSIVTQGDGWRLYTEGSGDDISSTLEYLDYYDMTVAGVPVTSKNASNIQGENITGSVSVSQDGWKIVLTLNGATISGGVVFDSSKDLYVNFNGENSISGGDSYAINSTNDTMTNQWIVFEKANNSSSATITLTNNTQNDKSGTIGGGFDETHNDGLYRIDDNNATQFTTTFTTDLFANGSGTMSDPYIIKTANDLKNFSNFINSNVIENTACAKLSDDINAETGLDCTNLTGFEPIGAGDLPYKGTFNGNGKTISNLSYTAPTDLEYVGLFGYVNGATITNLTINNCTFNGSKHVGGIAGYINDATISSCTVNNSTISCSNTENVDNVWTAGGIVGYCEYDPSGEEPTTVSGNNVIGETTVSCSKTAGNGNAVAGAIVGHHRTTTFTNNIYEYSVSVSTKQPTDENATVSSGYTKRGSGCKIDDSGETPQAEYELTDVDGIAMYTMKVILPEETSEGSVMGLEGTYYDIFEDDTDWGILVAPGQTVTLNAIPGDGYVIASLTATNTTTEATISTSSENLGDNTTQYTFIMPDAPVTVALTAAQTMGIRVAGVEVTELNADDVLGDGKVSFTPAGDGPATLTLNNATINGRIFSELQGGLTVYLLGSTIIDGGYVENNSDQPGDIAFVTEGENVPLTFTTNKTTPGLLLMKNTARDGEVPMYYQGFANPSFGNGLSTALNDNKCLIAKAPVVEPGEGIHWTDQTYTISGLEGATIKYKDYKGKISETTYNEPFGIQNTGKYYLGIWQTLTVAETEFDLYSNNVNYIVHNKPTFSLSTENVYESPAELKLENLPTDLATTIDTYPQVWYYFGENVEDSVQYTSAEQPIAVSESTKVCVYILDEDSDKIYKSKTVEAEYDVRASAGLSYIDTQTAKPVELVQYTIGGEDNPTLPMLTNESELPVSFSSSETDVATIDEEGNVTIVGVGLTRITATTEMTEDYVPGEATYDLKVYKDLSHESIQVTVEDVVFDGESKTPADFITVTDGNYELTYNEDYRISSPEGLVTNVGSYTITIEGGLDDSYYVGSKQVTFKIVNRTLADNEVTFYNNWATYYSAVGDVMLPTDKNIGAFVATGIGDGVVTVSQISYIPEGVAVLLNNATETVATEAFDVEEGINLLQHANAAVVVSEISGTVYGLYNGTMMRVSGTIPKGKNYLVVADAVGPQGASQLTIVIDGEGNFTSINDVRSKTAETGADFYDMQGRKVQKPSKKGLYISNGQKVVVK